MIKEKALELSKILKAYSEGKRLQIGCYSKKEINKTILWRDMHPELDDTYLSLENMDDCFFRVKPESRLVPFTFEDSHLFLGKVVKGTGVQTNNTMKQLITACSEMFVWTGSISQGKRYNELLLHYEFEDGSPCGKLIE